MRYQLSLILARRFTDTVMTLAEVANRMDVGEKYVREWLKCN